MSQYRKTLEELLAKYPEVDDQSDGIKEKSWDLYQLSSLLENHKITGSYYRSISKRIIASEV